MGKRNKGIAADPAKVAAAQAVVVDALGIDPATTTSTTSWKIPCFYGACDRVFAPHGSGAVIHSGCTGAAPVWRAFIASKGDPAKRAALVAKATALIAK